MDRVELIVTLLKGCVEYKQFVEVVPCLWVLAHTMRGTKGL
jgi:hypothetical protein